MVPKVSKILPLELLALLKEMIWIYAASRPVVIQWPAISVLAIYGTGWA